MGMAAIFVMWPNPFDQTFVFHPMEAPHKIWLQSAKQFLRKKYKKILIWVTLEQGQWMTLTFVHIGSGNHLVNCIYQF